MDKQENNSENQTNEQETVIIEKKEPVQKQTDTISKPEKEEITEPAKVVVEPAQEVTTTQTIVKVSQSKESIKEKHKKTITDKFALSFIIIGFISTFVAYIPLMSILFLAFYYLILFCAMVFTLFTLLLNEDFQNLLTGGQNVADTINTFMPYCWYVFGGALAFLVASLVLYCFSKYKARKVAGIVLSALFIIIAVVGLILTMPH